MSNHQGQAHDTFVEDGERGGYVLRCQCGDTLALGFYFTFDQAVNFAEAHDEDGTSLRALLRRTA